MIELDGKRYCSAKYFLHPTGEVNLGLMQSEKLGGKRHWEVDYEGVLIQLGHQMGIQR